MGFAMQVPHALIYKGKPVDPLCLTDINQTTARVDLSRCGISTDATRSIAQKNQQLIEQGYIGYDFHIKINPSVRLQGYSYYKIWGMNGKAVIVETIYHGGGTGELFTLSLVQRDGDSLNIRVLNAGDRCNHGIANVVRKRDNKGDYLLYNVKLTSYELVALAHDNMQHVKAYDDLEDCAICCKATATFRRDVGANFAHEQLRYVDLAAFPQDKVESSSPQKYQVCFDKLFRTYLQEGRTKLNQQQLIQFAKRFNGTCIRTGRKK
jgi:hypothetical protein